MAQKKLIAKNVPYSGVRAVISGSSSITGNSEQVWYSEGRGDRFYVNELSATASPVLESATFISYISFTMSGAQIQKYDLIPMEYGESAFVETVVYAQNSDASKGYVERFFGAWRHAGATISQIGSTLSTTKFSDFTGVNTTWGTTATQSINISFFGQSGESIDFDVHIRYTKGTHNIIKTIPPTTISPIYPTS